MDKPAEKLYVLVEYDPTVWKHTMDIAYQLKECYLHLRMYSSRPVRESEVKEIFKREAY